MSDLQPVFNGEMQLMNWGESSANGAWVKFWITPEDLEAFRSLKCKSGKIAGHRVAAVLVEIGDDELPVQREPQQDRPKGGALAKLAGMWCAEPEFAQWAQHEGWCDVNDADSAAAHVRTLCVISSRAELDSNPDAKRLFDERIRGPYSKFRAR